MKRAAKRFINYLRSERGMSPSTVHSYREDLKKFIEFLESHQSTRIGNRELPDNAA